MKNRLKRVQRADGSIGVRATQRKVWQGELGEVGMGVRVNRDWTRHAIWTKPYIKPVKEKKGSKR